MLTFFAGTRTELTDGVPTHDGVEVRNEVERERHRTFEMIS
jgi:hypothetical protein